MPFRLVHNVVKKTELRPIFVAINSGLMYIRTMDAVVKNYFLLARTPKLVPWESEEKQLQATRRAFYGARSRCYNPKASGYEYYGGRGIIVVWDTFEDFIADMGLNPSPLYSLDRIDPDGDYSASNCRWATWSVQRRNQRR